jgi:tRNA threonylcarbamoyladenosine biosynthesis protein TsaE
VSEIKTITINNEEDTRAFGLELAKKLKPGDVIALIGDLGTGKTTLTKSIAEGLGISDMITSPTFTIVQEYASGRLPLYHFDVYRLCDLEEMYELGYEEYFFGQGVCVIEWADLIMEIVPEEAIVIRIEYGADNEERTYAIENFDRWQTGPESNNK